jgi:hypothetical protein
MTLFFFFLFKIFLFHKLNVFLFLFLFFFLEIDTATRTNEACCCVPRLEPHQLSTGPPWSDHDWWTEKACLYRSKGVLDSWASLIHMQFNYRWHCHSLTRKKISCKILKNKSTLILFCDYFPKKVALFSRSPISVLNLTSNDFKNTSTFPISYFFFKKNLFFKYLTPKHELGKNYEQPLVQFFEIFWDFVIFSGHGFKRFDRLDLHFF